MNYTYEFQVYDPDTQGPPTTKLDALHRVRKVLEREGAWCQGSWFHNRHPELDPNDAFCNDWNACLDGMVVMVVIGAARRTAVNGVPMAERDDRANFVESWTVFSDPLDVILEEVDPALDDQNWDLVNEVRAALVEAINDEFPYSKGGIVGFNDSHDRDDVIRVVDRAIENASA